MLLLHQLPAGSISIPVSPVSFPSLSTLPVPNSILLSLLASLVLLSFVRAVFLCLRKNVGKQGHPQSRTHVDEKTGEAVGAPSQRPSLWAWAPLTWANLPSVSLALPVSLTVAGNSTMGKGVGLQQQRKPVEAPTQTWQQQARGRRGGLTFESPGTNTLNSFLA